MTPLAPNVFRAAARFWLALLFPTLSWGEPAPALSAAELALRLSEWQQDGVSYARARMDIKQASGAPKNTMQIQIKARRTKAVTEVFYQILWPKERKGEGVLLRKAKDGSASGAIFMPPEKLRSLGHSDLQQSLFDSDLSFEDLVDNVFAWKHQTIVGTEDVGGVSCPVLESKPGKGDRSSFTAVRTWVDPRRLVPWRIEKYVGNRPVRRIDTANVVTDDIGRPIPSNITVRGSQRNSVTELDGSRIKHDVTYPEGQFTPEALKEVTIPRAAPD
jgi:Outer membrane lipoprotein-sorting protein